MLKEFAGVIRLTVSEENLGSSDGKKIVVYNVLIPEQCSIGRWQITTKEELTAFIHGCRAIASVEGNIIEVFPSNFDIDANPVGRLIDEIEAQASAEC